MIESPPPMPSWVTVVGNVYYQSPAAAPTVVESRSQRLLAGDEQPYRRTFKVGADWRSLDCGWLAGGCALLVLANEAPQFRVVPTPEERAAALARVVEVALAATAPQPFAVIRPGEDCRFEPAALNLVVRCRSGETKATVAIIPL